MSSLDLTGNAWDVFYDMVDSPTFNLEDESSEVIFDALKNNLTPPKFGFYLKRYICRAQGRLDMGDLEDKYFSDSIVLSFKARNTPSSFEQSSTTLGAAAKNWINAKTVSRKTVFLLGLGLNMSPDDVNMFLTKGIYEQEINPKDPFEVICWYCFKNELDYSSYEILWENYQELDACFDPDLVYSNGQTSLMRNNMEFISNSSQLFDYLSRLKISNGLSSFSSTLKQCFTDLYNEVRDIIAEEYNYSEFTQEKVSEQKDFSEEEISAGDVESFLYDGTPKTKDGNLLKDKLSDFKEVFKGLRLTRQKIGKIINGEDEATRFDLITLLFAIHSQSEEDNIQKRYAQFEGHANETLRKCFMEELIIQNPYENFILACMFTEYPLNTHRDVWVDSFNLE